MPLCEANTYSWTRFSRRTGVTRETNWTLQREKRETPKSEVAPGDLQSTVPVTPLATWGDAPWSKIPIPYPQTQSQFTSRFCVFSNFIPLQLAAALQPDYTKLQYLHREFHLVFHKYSRQVTVKSSQLWRMCRLEGFAFLYYTMCNIFHLKIFSKHLMTKTTPPLSSI